MVSRWKGIREEEVTRGGGLEREGWMRAYHDAPGERNPEGKEEDDGFVDEELDCFGRRVFQNVFVTFSLLDEESQTWANRA
jgi:hypothetical protein